MATSNMWLDIIIGVGVLALLGLLRSPQTFRMGVIMIKSEFKLGMNDTETMLFLREESRKLNDLMKDPHPGLGTWALAFAVCMQSLSDYWNQKERVDITTN